MFKVIATDVVISKGYDGAPALKFSENGESVRFRIGKKVYDTRAENNTRWVNLSVKAFGPVCERIKKMQLKESSFINILGRLDEDVWEDSTTHEKRSAMVVILDEIEYCSSGGGKQKTEEAGEQPRAAAAPAKAAAPQVEAGIPGDVVAAIMAAIYSMGNGKYVLKAVRRGKNGWGKAGVNDTTAPF